MSPQDARQAIVALDSQLLVSAERFSTYKQEKRETSMVVQMGVINRQLDHRLVLMDVRDGL